MKNNRLVFLEGVIVMSIDFESLVNSENWEDRMKAAQAGYGLERLVNDRFWGVRAEIARQGYGLEQLVHDGHWCVRVAVAQQGFGLEILVHDKEWAVRRAVAEQRYGLDKIANDSERVLRDFARWILGNKDKGNVDDMTVEDRIKDADVRCRSKWERNDKEKDFSVEK